MEWINCNDRLPELDDAFLCFNRHYNVWDDEEGDDYYTDAIGGKVTHWMPLPQPPVNEIK